MCVGALLVAILCQERAGVFNHYLFTWRRVYTDISISKTTQKPIFLKKYPEIARFPLQFSARDYDESMEIRHGKKEDLPALMAIFKRARAFMAETGNPHQWGDHDWPPQSLIEEDIEQGHNYVIEEDGEIVGTFFFIYGIDVEPTYIHMVSGAWKKEGSYGVIHRIASSGKVKGIGKAALDFASRFIDHLRIDTHEENKVMQNLLEKEGFVLCGTIAVGHDRSPRLAYER